MPRMETIHISYNFNGSDNLCIELPLGTHVKMSTQKDVALSKKVYIYSYF